MFWQISRLTLIPLSARFAIRSSLSWRFSVLEFDGSDGISERECETDVDGPASECERETDADGPASETFKDLDADRIDVFETS
jgi:hypothetical protein